ncbi:MAG: hypothetical protein MAG715_00238 [Methanonatronarchaeales archaeon]|nr:hypothetical protein [Methanonatronarchaeales archaeon]
MAWYREVTRSLEGSGLFEKVSVAGAKVRAEVDETIFLDIYHDPTTGSYSYALIDLTLKVEGDKRLIGWDDYPHEGVDEIEALDSYPHHFQRREGSEWLFEESPVRGEVEEEIDLVLEEVSRFLEDDMPS